MKFFLSLILGIYFFAFSGCQFEPPYAPPPVLTSYNWKTTQTEVVPNPPQVDLWWEVFQDPTLNTLEQLVLENNWDLEAALRRVEEGRDLANIARAALFPQLSLTPSYSNQEILTKLFGPIPAGTKNLVRAHELLYQLPLSLSYELDIWGKLRDTYKAAALSARAREEAFQSILLMLTADLASAYFQLRAQDTQIDLYLSTIQTRQKAVAITTARYEGKIANYNDVALAQLDLSNVESQYYDAIRLRALFEDQIAVLVGLPPAEVEISHSPLTDIPPAIPAGIPAQILTRRPDIASQERIMASYHAQIGVAYASFLPAIDLTGGIGWSSPVFKDFLKKPSNYWLLGTNITQTVFDGGNLYYNLLLSWADYQEALANYQQQALTAFQEVEDALSNLEWLAKEMGSVKNSIAAAQTAYDISLDRYKEGVDFYLQVVDDERQLLDNQRAYIGLLSTRYVNTVQLIRALGGIWDKE